MEPEDSDPAVESLLADWLARREAGEVVEIEGARRASTIARLAAVSANGNVLNKAIDAASPPLSDSIAAGMPCHFQAWFRDTAAGGSGFNPSDGYKVTFTS